MKFLLPILSAIFLACHATPDSELDATSEGEGGSSEGSSGGGPPIEPSFHSGERLRARTWVETGTVDLAGAMFIGWYDALLDANCLMTRALGGETRCLPTDTHVFRVFPDSYCEPGTGVGRIQGADCSVRYAYYQSEIPAEEYTTETGVVAVLGPSDATHATHSWLRTIPGTCEKLDPPDDPSQYKYCEIADMGPEEFVQSEAELVPVGQLRRELVTGTDGSSTVETRTFDPTSDDVLYRSGDGETLIPGAGCHSEGELAIPYETVGAGEGRLQMLWIASEGQPVNPTVYFHDVALDTRCRPAKMPDGQIRCVPDSYKSYFDPFRMNWGWQPVFADENCTELVGHEFTSECSVEVPRFASRFNYNGVDTASDVFRMIPAGDAAGTTWAGWDLPGVMNLPCMARAEGAPYYRAEPVPLSELATLTSVTE